MSRVFMYTDELQSQLCRHLLKTVCTDIVNTVLRIYATEAMMSLPDSKDFTTEVCGMLCHSMLFLPAGCVKRKLMVLYLLTGRKSGFSPHRGDSWHRFMLNLAWPMGRWVHLAVLNFISICAGGGNVAPKY